MTGCSAPNCTNHSKNGFKFHRFPTDPERRKCWLINSRRKDWNPTPNDRLCTEHFEERQFELNRADGKKLLKPNAVPTIFNVTNPPRLLDSIRQSCYKRSADDSSKEPHKRIKLSEPQPVQETFAFLQRETLEEYNVAQRNIELENENKFLKNKVKELENKLKNLTKTLGKFISQEQFENLEKDKVY